MRWRNMAGGARWSGARRDVLTQRFFVRGWGAREFRSGSYRYSAQDKDRTDIDCSAERHGGCDSHAAGGAGSPRIISKGAYRLADRRALGGIALRSWISAARQSILIAAAGG